MFSRRKSPAFLWLTSFHNSELMPGQSIKIAPLFAVAGGVLLLWSGMTGKKWSSVLKDLISGKSPAKTPQTNPISGSIGSPGNPALISPSAAIPKGTTFTTGQLQSLWVLAGGSPSTMARAACIAMAESRGDSAARNPAPCAIGSYAEGLWQICMPLNSRYVPGGDAFNPLANAKAAVTMSQNGTDWSQWATAGDC